MIRRPDLRWVLTELWLRRGVEGDAAAAEAALRAQRGDESPMVVRVLVGAGAWVAALLLALLVGLLELFEPPAGFVVGPSAVGAGWALHRSAGAASVFRGQIALSVSIAGHVLLWVLLVEELGGDSGTAVAAVLMAASLWLWDDPVHRFASAVGLAAVPLVMKGGPDNAPAALWAGALAVGLAVAVEAEVVWQRSRVADGRAAGLQAPVMWALAATLVALLALLDCDAPVRWALSAAMGSTLAVVLWRAGREAEASRGSLAVALGAVALGTALTAGVPGVMAAALAIVLGARRAHPVLLSGGIVALIGFVVLFYRQLDGSLLFKAGAMFGAGAVLLAGAGWASRALTRGGAVEGEAAPPRRWVAIGLVAVVGAIGWMVVGKERVLASGRVVLLELAPVDPRSLMQGDYMVLRYGMALRLDLDTWPADGRLVLRLGGDGVATLVGRDTGQPLGEGEVWLRYRIRQREMRLGAESFFFAEKQGHVYENARYGELRVAPDGDAVLVGLRDGRARPLGERLE